MKYLMVLLLIATSADAQVFPNFLSNDYQVLQITESDEAFAISNGTRFICQLSRENDRIELLDCVPLLTPQEVAIFETNAKVAEIQYDEITKLNSMSLEDVDQTSLSFLKANGCEFGLGLPGSEMPESASAFAVAMGVDVDVANTLTPKFGTAMRESFDRLFSKGLVKYLNGRARVSLMECS